MGQHLLDDPRRSPRSGRSASTSSGPASSSASRRRARRRMHDVALEDLTGEPAGARSASSPRSTTSRPPTSGSRPARPSSIPRRRPAAASASGPTGDRPRRRGQGARSRGSRGSRTRRRSEGGGDRSCLLRLASGGSMEARSNRFQHPHWPANHGSKTFSNATRRSWALILCWILGAAARRGAGGFPICEPPRWGFLRGCLPAVLRASGAADAERASSGSDVGHAKKGSGSPGCTRTRTRSRVCVRASPWRS